MFTGIIETIGIVTQIIKEGTNIHFWIKSSISDQLKVDQSVSHNGVCLTVVETDSNKHRVTAIQETLEKSNLGNLKLNDVVNLERCLQLNQRLDGHMVQGHIDGTGVCIRRTENEGSWVFTFSFPSDSAHLLVNKGSVCINGVSLTVNNPDTEKFEVAIIPYTMEFTNFNSIQEGDIINLEFDIIGKYLERYRSLLNPEKFR